MGSIAIAIQAIISPLLPPVRHVEPFAKLVPQIPVVSAMTQRTHHYKLTTVHAIKGSSSFLQSPAQHAQAFAKLVPHSVIAVPALIPI